MNTYTETQQNESGKVDLIGNNVNDISTANFLMKTVNSPIRQRLINLLLFNEKLAVHEMVKETGLEQSIVSQHLAILRKAKLVRAKRDKKEVFYAINEDYLKEIIDFVKKVTIK